MANYSDTGKSYDQLIKEWGLLNKTLESNLVKYTPSQISRFANRKKANMYAARKNKRDDWSDLERSIYGDEDINEDIVNLEGGIHKRVYYDSEGILTAGLGHKLVGDELHLYGHGQEVPDWQIKKWYEEDMAKIRRTAMKSIEDMKLDPETDLGREMLRTMESVHFQGGPGMFSPKGKFKGTWGHMAANRWEEAAKELMRTSSGQRVDPNNPAHAGHWAVQTPVRAKALESMLLKLAENKRSGRPTYAKASKKAPEEFQSSDYGTIEADVGSPRRGRTMLSWLP